MCDNGGNAPSAEAWPCAPADTKSVSCPDGNAGFTARRVPTQVEWIPLLGGGGHRAGAAPDTQWPKLHGLDVLELARAAEELGGLLDCARHGGQQMLLCGVCGGQSTKFKPPQKGKDAG